MKVKALGIDPGVSGGIVLGELSEEKTEVLEAFAMPESFEDIRRELGRALGFGVAFAFIEDVPKFCGVELSAARISSLFRNIGFLEGILVSSPHVELIRFAPLKWMNLVSQDSTRSRLRPERKRQLKDLASRTFPTHKWSYATCDAALILEAGRRFIDWTLIDRA